jgi:hypothetical protein
MLLAQLNVRQMDLDKARAVLGQAIGRCPKDSLFKVRQRLFFLQRLFLQRLSRLGLSRTALERRSNGSLALPRGTSSWSCSSGTSTVAGSCTSGT